jgi:Uri superfamily endonuclease
MKLFWDEVNQEKPEQNELSQRNPDQNCGIYYLLVYLKNPEKVEIGKLGLRIFPRGYYIYTGSAKRNLTQRLERHLKKKKKHHWHIDYLTTRGQIEQILVDSSGRMTECKRAKRMISHLGGEIVVPRFGSSDCRCPAHLAYFETKPFLDRRTV